MPHRGRSVIKVVDDDESVRDSICALLESHDLPSRNFSSAQDALARIDWSSAGCVLLDQHMPGMTGIEFLRAIRAAGNKTPVIMMTGHRERDFEARARDAGANATMLKPLDDGRLIALLREMLAVKP